MDSPEALKNIIARERKIRKAAEAIIEEKSLELYLAKEKAEAATIAKSQFLSNMSHEIRTPLNAIMGLVELIREDSTDELAQNHANTIKHSADNLLKIINEILDFSKIEAGEITFEKVEFHLDKLIVGLKNIFQFEATDKNLDFIIELDPQTPLYLKGDQGKFNQILVNLVGNAFKFTEEGEVKIRIHPRKINNQECTLSIEVSDTGIGIPKSKQSGIFESFSQANNSTTRLYGGTGLGLAITKNLVELQNGSICLKSEKGIGTCFSITLPFEIAEAPDLNPKSPEPSHNFEVLKNIRVLVVEDIVVNRLFMKHVFRRKSIPVHFAVNGKEAVSILTKESFDIVFMDLHMPEMDGWEATRIIRSLDSPVLNHHVPIFALSADAFEETQSEAKAIGMNGFITKPVNIHLVYDTLIELFSTKQQVDPIPPEKPKTE